MLSKIKQLRIFLGEQVWALFVATSIIGVLWFLVESSFIFVMQGFLVAIELTTPDQSNLPDWYPTELKFSLLILILFGIFRSGILASKFYIGSKTYQAFIRYQRSKILAYALRNAAYVSTHHIMNVFTERIEKAGQFLQIMSIMILALTSALLFFLLGLSLAPLEMLIGITLLAFLIYPMKLLSMKINMLGHGLIHEWENINKVLIHGLKNSFLLDLYRQTNKEILQGISHLKHYEKHFNRYHKIVALKNSVPLFLGIVVVSIISFISINYLNTGGLKLVSFIYLFIRLSQASSEAAACYADLKLQVPGLKHLITLDRDIDAFSAQASANDHAGQDNQIFMQDIHENGISFSLNNISFGYAEEHPLIKDLSLKVKRGEVLLISGPTGSGKSTLLKLLVGMIPPHQGNIEVNNHDINLVKKSLAPYIAYVGPESYLIPGSVRKNLLYAHDVPHTISDSKLWEALNWSLLDNDIKDLPLQLDELLNEQTQLSTGQKQRLCLARALLRNPKLLILDEATANLDHKTEHLFINHSLARITPRLVTIVVSHRDSYNKIASKKITLKQVKTSTYLNINTQGLM